MNHVKRTYAVAILLALAAAAGAGRSALAEHEHHGSGATATPAKPAKPEKGPVQGKLMVITGEVIDPACFLEAGVKSIGPGHFQCAIDCARSGQTLAIYDRANDKLYMLAGEMPGTNPNDPVIQYVHKLVDVTGRVYTRGGVSGIVIAKVQLHPTK